MTADSFQGNACAAPWYTVPEEPIMSVEHPCVVKNNLKGIDMLGGSRGVSQALDAGIEQTLALRFHPQNPASKSVLSLHHRTNNVLLRITVPKRTGRKRKRGTLDDFAEDPADTRVKMDNSGHRTTSALLRAMRDNVGSYKVDAIGNIASTHVWRNMPDLVFSTRGKAFMKDIERDILPTQYDAVRRFQFPRVDGSSSATDLVPPSVFSTMSLPYTYIYRQNQISYRASDDKDTDPSASFEKSAATRTYTQQWKYDAKNVPTRPMDQCPALENQAPAMQKLVKEMEAIFAKRPIWSRRAMLNQLPKDAPAFLVKHAIAYVAYPIRSGPWRDALCRYSVDPRVDPDCHQYQTVLLQVATSKIKGHEDQSLPEQHNNRQGVPSGNDASHIFDGQKPVPSDGKVWQLCDLEDPQLKSLARRETSQLRTECDIRTFGWYPNGVMAKIRILLKIKIDHLLAGTVVEPESFQQFLDFPDWWEPPTDALEAGDASLGYMPKSASKDELDWGAAYRNIARGPVEYLTPANDKTERTDPASAAKTSGSYPPAAERNATIDRDRDQYLAAEYAPLGMDDDDPDDDNQDNDQDDDGDVDMTL